MKEHVGDDIILGNNRNKIDMQLLSHAFDSGTSKKGIEKGKEYHSVLVYRPNRTFKGAYWY